MGMLSNLMDGKYTIANAVGETVPWLQEKGAFNPFGGSPVNDFVDKVKRVGTDLGESYVETLGNSEQDNLDYKRGDANAADLVWRAAGDTGELVGDTISAGASVIIPDWVTKTAGDLMQSGVEATLDTTLAKQGLEYLAANPRIARNIEAGMGIAELGLPKALLEPVKRALSAASCLLYTSPSPRD